ncbi:MAG: fructose-1,6-bisphosphate aldolase Fba [Candidatus Berkelbacteria bacterium Licking1014_96]|uniref:Fructose-1,6-bisphosphate aldolase Fba n=1 Tax=Candidatus Berkelbacteria bacterium Licking1014_96 TaxID=2017149 RepID=A0A554LGV6_9BACT|nr:MAG: fructose-1,6-bisphosphate aldolase Fba [Candidatus Berkelbacteria bacterium Licking1014_96]
MIISSKELLIDARREGRAISHFNVFNLESAMAVISAIEEAKKPAFVAITETTIKYAGLEVIVGIIKQLVKKASTDFILHLDHGKNLEIIKNCLKVGFTSVMIDGSALHLEENIEMTLNVVNMAHKKNVAVEAELGHVGRVGEIISEGYFTKPSRAEEFVERTNVDSLAVAVGTIHGLVTKMSIDYKRLDQISKIVKIPLVIHGGTGLKNEEIKKIISYGVAKINIDTALRIAFMRGLRQNITENDPRKALSAAMEEEKTAVKNFIELFNKGSNNE